MPNSLSNYYALGLALDSTPTAVCSFRPNSSNNGLLLSGNLPALFQVRNPQGNFSIWISNFVPSSAILGKFYNSTLSNFDLIVGSITEREQATNTRMWRRRGWRGGGWRSKGKFRMNFLGYLQAKYLPIGSKTFDGPLECWQSGRMNWQEANLYFQRQGPRSSRTRCWLRISEVGLSIGSPK